MRLRLARSNCANFMNSKFVLKLVLAVFTITAFWNAEAQAWPILGKSKDLPPGVPRLVDTNGNVLDIPHKFTTGLYQDEALKLVLQEANQVAKELNFTNELPIAKSNLVEFHISPFGFSYANKMIGTRIL
jgi:hypothetical protein